MTRDAWQSAHARVIDMTAYGPGNPDWDRRHRLLGEITRDLDPDVVAPQEMSPDPHGDPGRILGEGYHLAPFSRPENGIEGSGGDALAAPPRHRA